MGFAQEYNELLSQDGYEKIKSLIETGNIVPEYEYLDFKKDEYEGQNFYSILINTNDKPVSFYAYLMVSYFNKKELFEYAKDDEIFPMFFVVIPTRVQSKKDNVDRSLFLKHELTHLNDLLRLYESDPDFITRGVKYAFTNVQASGNKSKSVISKCMTYEVEKIFKVEPQAMRLDSENDEEDIFNFFPSHIKSGLESDDIIKVKIAYYLIKKKDEIIEYVKGNNELTLAVETAFSDSINKYGKDLFGEDANNNLQAFGKKMALMMLQYLPSLKDDE